jgi:hypothetical protein
MFAGTLNHGSAMNAFPDSIRPNETEDDSPTVVLRSLEQERGTIFSNEEYQQMREAIIEELARGPKPRLSLLLTFGFIGLLLLALTVIGFALVWRGMVADVTLGIVGVCALGVWAYLLRGYLAAVRKQSSRSLGERLAELEELRVQRLISQIEYEHILAAIHMGRQSVRRSRP